jgi:hypothetical protein
MMAFCVFVVCRLLLLSAILCQCISEKLQLAVGFFKYILYFYKLIILILLLFYKLFFIYLFIYTVLGQFCDGAKESMIQRKDLAKHESIILKTSFYIFGYLL